MTGLLLTVQCLGLAGVDRGTDFHQKKVIMNHWKEEKDLNSAHFNLYK